MDSYRDDLAALRLEKTTIQLGEKERALLRAHQRRTGATMSGTIRLALAHYLTPEDARNDHEEAD